MTQQKGEMMSEPKVTDYDVRKALEAELDKVMHEFCSRMGVHGGDNLEASLATLQAIQWLRWSTRNIAVDTDDD